MRRRFLTPSLLMLSLPVLAGAAAPAATAAEPAPRAVIELFTSQGCSSCPPADKLAGKLAQDPSLVVLTMPIDYWDYLGWKDTLAVPRNTARQRAYAKARGDRQVYTPQVVVNGFAQALGSDRREIENAIARSRRQSSILSVPVTVAASDGRLRVSVQAGKDGTGAGEVWACALIQTVPISIERGENRGRMVTYYNVTRKWMKIGDWSGAAKTLDVPLDDLKPEGADAVAVLLQGGTPERPGAVLGAALTELK